MHNIQLRALQSDRCAHLHQGATGPSYVGRAQGCTTQQTLTMMPANLTTLLTPCPPPMMSDVPAAMAGTYQARAGMDSHLALSVDC
jgi:hypothetical protein